MLKFLLPALGIAALMFLVPGFIASAVKALGLGFFLILGWIGAGICALKRAPKSWNRWAGAALLTLFAFGVLSLLSPSVSLAGVSLEEIGGGGLWGREFVSPLPAGIARLCSAFLLGIFALSPERFIGAGRRAAMIFKLRAPRLIPSATATAPPARRAEEEAREIPSSEGSQASESSEAEPPAASEEIAPASSISEEPEFVLRPDALPPLEILSREGKAGWTPADLEERAKLLEQALASYGVEAKVVEINPGPAVTQFGVEPGWERRYRRVPERDAYGRIKRDKNGNPIFSLEEVSRTRVRVEKIKALADDLALALAVPSVRIETPIPGKPLIGIEVPNTSTAIVPLREVMESSAFQKLKAKSKLAIPLGQGAGGEPVVADLAQMPHLLIAGATGSGKTVCLNSIITSLIMQNFPWDLRLVLIDPKKVEMIQYNGIPHLLEPVITEPGRALEALKRVMKEMEERYKRFARVKARNIESYNKSPEAASPLPYIVVIIDELADLMMNSPHEVEAVICRLAQLARATGIHLVVATQRPSVDVVTGLIKANFPARISFAVTSTADSRTILDTAGAEKLLGRGDMLFLPPDAPKPRRLRGCFVSDEDIEKVVDFWRRWASLFFPPELDHFKQSYLQHDISEEDPYLERARALAQEVQGKISASLLQRRLRVGYARAVELLEKLRAEGLVEEEV